MTSMLAAPVCSIDISRLAARPRVDFEASSSASSASACLLKTPNAERGNSTTRTASHAGPSAAAVWSRAHRILGELLSRAHQRHVLAEGKATVLVLQLLFGDL